MSDLISRQAVLDLIVASVNQFGGWYTTDMMNMWGLFTQVIKAMPSAEPEKRTNKRTETHECDLISRQDVLKIIRNHIKETDSEYVKSVLVNLAECVKDTRSAEPDLEEDEDIPMEYFENGGI